MAAAEFRPATRELVGPVATEVLERRVAQVLVELIDAGGEPVTRNDLLARCWGGVIVEESALNRAIGRIRRAGQATGPGCFTIETLSKLGYRLVAPIAEYHAPARRVERRWLLGGAAAMTVTAGAAVWSGVRWPGSPAAPGDIQARDLRSRAANELRYHLPERDAQAVALFKEAVAPAPKNSGLWGLLALAYQREAEMGAPQPAELATFRTQAAARRALELDPTNADAQVSLALIAPVFRNWAAAEREYR